MRSPIVVLKDRHRLDTDRKIWVLGLSDISPSPPPTILKANLTNARGALHSAQAAKYFINNTGNGSRRSSPWQCQQKVCTRSRKLLSEFYPPTNPYFNEISPSRQVSRTSEAKPRTRYVWIRRTGNQQVLYHFPPSQSHQLYKNIPIFRARAIKCIQDPWCWAGTM